MRYRQFNRVPKAMETTRDWPCLVLRRLRWNLWWERGSFCRRPRAGLGFFPFDSLKMRFSGTIIVVQGEHFAYFPARLTLKGWRILPAQDSFVTQVDVDVLRQVNMSLTRNLDFCQSGEGSKALSEVLGLREDFKSHLSWAVSYTHLTLPTICSV